MRSCPEGLSLPQAHCSLAGHLRTFWEQKDAVESGLPRQLRFLDGLPRSPGLISRDTALHNYGILHFRGVRFPPFRTFTSVNLCINTIRFESSITKANKAGLGRDSKIT